MSFWWHLVLVGVPWALSLLLLVFWLWLIDQEDDLD